MWNYRTPGIPDDLFITSKGVPGPTKEEIRVLTISKARLREGFYVADVGCGVGSLTVEAALQVGPFGKVFAIDENEEAIKITKENVTKFNVQDTVEIICGKAPEAMRNLPSMDAVIVGGSASLKGILETSWKKLKEGGRIVVNAVMLETAYEALRELKRLKFGDIDIATIFVAKGRFVSDGVMMLARNPITVISATKLGKNLLGKFFGVGVGPGNPQLITIKALQVLRSVDVICAPKASSKKSSRALKTVKTIIEDSNKRQETIELVYPMVKDRKLLQEAVERNAELIVSKLRDGKDVAYVTLGDPMLYSTFINTYRKVVEKLPDVDVEIIPGVTSFSVCAATSKMPIAEAEETVAIVPATSNLEKLEMLAQQADTMVLMKGLKDVEDLFKALTKGGFSENSQVVVAADLGTPAENVKTMKLHELRKIKSQCQSYFSTIIVRREKI